MVEESKIPDWVGAWLGTLILSPLAFLFTHRASKDMGFGNFDVILQPIKNLLSKLKKDKKEE